MQKNIKAQNTQNEGRKKRSPKKITETYLHNAGLYYLQRFASSSENFRRVMLRKVLKSCRAHADQDYETCAGMVDDLIKKFIDIGLLNDEVYARGAVTSLRRQGKSKRLIMGKLKSKGVQHELIEDGLLHVESAAQCAPGESEFQAALIFARKKKIGPFDTGDKPKDKALASLARAGFSYDIARRVMDSDPAETQDL